MTLSALLLNSVLMLVAASCAFLFRFIQAGVFPDAAQKRHSDRDISATAWGEGSMGASESFSGCANIFAAMSLGFLAPADDVCKHARVFTGAACFLRSAPH